MALETLLTPKEAAAKLRVSIATLRGWRRQGKGPTVVRMSRRTFRYSEDDLREFIEAAYGRTTHPNRYLPAGSSFLCRKCGCEFRGKACPSCNQEANASTEVVRVARLEEREHKGKEQ